MKVKFIYESGKTEILSFDKFFDYVAFCKTTCGIKDSFILGYDCLGEL